MNSSNIFFRLEDTLNKVDAVLHTSFYKQATKSFYSMACTGAALTALLFTSQVQAENLLQIYQRAVENDPVIRAAEATYKASVEAQTQSRSVLLPQITANASISSNTSEIKRTNSLTGTTDGDLESDFGDSSSWSVNLNQSILDMSKWFSFKQGKYLSKQAEAKFAADQQDLIVRVAQAYFDVLRAEENLSSSQAEERANKQRLEQTRQRFDVGLIAITEVHEAQASYDQTVVNRLTDEASLGTAMEKLAVLTGEHYDKLWKLKENFVTKTPQPEDRASWVDFALENNSSLQAARAAMMASQQNSKSKKAGHYPTLSGNISYGTSDLDSEFTGLPNDYTENNESTDLSVSLNLSWPLYTGGLTSSSRRQALQEYNASRENLTATERGIIQTTRALHLNIMTSIARVKANRQSIVSAQSALESTEAGYQVGTRNIVDVLEAQKILFQAKKNYANSKYDYILQMIQLKKAAGLLSPKDIEELNTALVYE